jgi:hypothetical protein
MRIIFGAIGRMKIGRGNRSTRRKPTPAPLCPPQNPAWQTPSRTPDRSCGKPVTNRLSYGAAFFSPISSPLTSRRVTVEVFDPASTRVDELSNYPTNSVGLSSSSEAAHRSATQEFPKNLWNQKFHYPAHKGLPLVPILNQVNPVHISPFYLSKIHYNVTWTPIVKKRVGKQSVARLRNNSWGCVF